MVELLLKIKLSCSEATRHVKSRADNSVINIFFTDPNIYTT
jgi:hypothetical protein